MKNLVKTDLSKVLCPSTCQPQIPTPDLLVADSDARPVNPRSWYPTWQPQIGPISQSQTVIPDQTTPDNLALVWQPPKSREVGGVQYAPVWKQFIYVFIPGMFKGRQLCLHIPPMQKWLKGHSLSIWHLRKQWPDIHINPGQSASSLHSKTNAQ